MASKNRFSFSRTVSSNGLPVMGSTEQKPDIFSSIITSLICSGSYVTCAFVGSLGVELSDVSAMARVVCTGVNTRRRTLRKVEARGADRLEMNGDDELDSWDTLGGESDSDPCTNAVAHA